MPAFSQIANARHGRGATINSYTSTEKSKAANLGGSRNASHM
jgi:hypothetical protein